MGGKAPNSLVSCRGLDSDQADSGDPRANLLACSEAGSVQGHAAAKARFLVDMSADDGFEVLVQVIWLSQALPLPGKPGACLGTMAVVHKRGIMHSHLGFPI